MTVYLIQTNGHNHTLTERNGGPDYSHVGRNVTESGGVVKIAQDAPDDGGRLISRPFTVNPTGLITLTIRARIHLSSPTFDKFRPNISLTETDQDGNGIHVAAMYHHMSFDDYSDRTWFGFGHPGFDMIAPIWDEWFVEEVKYDPLSGEANYSVNGGTPVTIPGRWLDGTTMVLDYNSFGWYSGHYTELDYVKIEQVPEPAAISLLALSGLTLIRRRKA